ncbi:GNAT family N-acetyltransferase [Paenibacillus sp. MZ04-78.2]|uniref:GNAT family N-acetyltransferase n=1 Tax=Paenibacillus sp. MZ04-78.2 TaxID=2962034 RepID=UPI0020B6DAA1|nr:GNAT family N-acetyltransferase [Paenibacillus sp. MZ04-78.2]MCP3773328.1 GNAT family N-acetyltransferase [Paenibacillus sp. MZ04-78.2]
MILRKLEPQDVEAFWSLRLKSLKEHPESFGSNYEDASLTGMDEVRRRFPNTADQFLLGAFGENNELMGMIGFQRESSRNLAHKGMLWGVYVDSAHQGKGIAKALLRHVLEEARSLDGLEQVNLSVVTVNEPAVRLYRSAGFEIFGTEPNALKIGDQSFDEYSMACKL